MIFECRSGRYNMGLRSTSRSHSCSYVILIPLARYVTSGGNNAARHPFAPCCQCVGRFTSSRQADHVTRALASKHAQSHQIRRQTNTKRLTAPSLCHTAVRGGTRLNGTPGVAPTDLFIVGGGVNGCGSQETPPDADFLSRWPSRATWRRRHHRPRRNWSTAAFAISNISSSASCERR